MRIAALMFIISNEFTLIVEEAGHEPIGLPSLNKTRSGKNDQGKKSKSACEE